MDYSLRTFIKNIEINSLTLQNFIDTLNLIGFEIDSILEEKVKTNKYVKNINVEIKIPSNREDLLIENLLIQELKTIFLLKIYNTWENLKSNYSFVLKQKYNDYQNYKYYPIKLKQKSIISYSVEIDNYKEIESPKWIKLKLETFNIKSTSLMNDLLQLINYEWGYTFNLIDYKIKEDEVFLLEQLEDSQTILDFSKKKIDLPKKTIVLKNKENRILSNVGSLNSKIQISDFISKTFLIESTFYDISLNSLRVNTLNTPLSFRYLRKSYLLNFKYAFQRLLTLLELLTDSKITSIIKTVNLEEVDLIHNKILLLNKNNLKQCLNIQNIDLNIFKLANLKIICNTQKNLYFSISNFRNDIDREIDLIEEYSRFIGYKNFPEVLPLKALKYYKNKQKNLEFIKQFFINHNFIEIVTNSLVENNFQNNNSLFLQNPLNNDFSILRETLLPTLISIFEKNIKIDSLSKNFFEIGRVFKVKNNKIIEQEKLTGIFSLPLIQIDENISFFIAKGFLENFLKNFGFINLNFKKLKLNLTSFHNGKVFSIFYNNKMLGIFGELNPTIKNSLFLKESIYLFEINLIYLKREKLNSKISLYKEYSKYPSITKDLSFAINKNINFNLIKNKIKDNIDNLKEISFFDIYFDNKILSHVNLGIRLKFQSNNETLLTENIESQIQKIRQNLINDFDVKFKE